MDINEIMTDGRIDLNKLHLWLDRKHGFALEYIVELVDAINDHIATLNQSTPITVELLARAGFVFGSKGHFTYHSPGFTVNGNWYENIKTMEQLATIHECYTGQPLNWQHDPAAEVKQRLEAMGFAQQKDKNVYCGNVGGIMLSIEVDSFAVYNFCPGYPLSKTGIKTIDALERVVKELRSE